MTRLLVVTRPSLALGFHLAGVDAYGVEDIESAEELIGGWLDSGETGLLALDDGLLAGMDADFIERLNAAHQLPYLAIPGGDPSELAVSRQQRIADMIRRAVGVHVTFKGRDAEEANDEPG